MANLPLVVRDNILGTPPIKTVCIILVQNYKIHYEVLLCITIYYYTLQNVFFDSK